ncbi:TetR-like C-terminal domain-containing protein [Bacillus haynesii]|uniref:TetR-like C-terminal domain-containing protein n=1 Tax=Bacillus haynesii TaxID=1925021 RepID=UPI003BF84967
MLILIFLRPLCWNFHYNFSFEFYTKADKNLDISMVLWVYLISPTAGGFWNILSKWFERGRKETPEEMSHILQGIVDSFFNKQAIER